MLTTIYSGLNNNSNNIKYNFNYDKDSQNVFGFQDGDECFETLNNTSDHTRWKSNDFETTKLDKDGVEYPAWQDDFEARFPDLDDPYSDVTRLKALATWLKSTDRDAVASETEKALRLQKFKDEIEYHMEKNDILFKYIFAETFLMVDNWAKNCFWTHVQNSRWFDLPYDFDTAIGINNEGALVFSPFLEDIDQLNGADVYNGQDSTLWRNVRDAFYPELSAMYNKLRTEHSDEFSYAAVEKRFEDHQDKWSESIFNEDALFKYIQPLYDEGTTAYLKMLQGSKSEQRKFWLYNRFKYLDSKYVAGDAASDVITIRGYAKADIGITPFLPIYCVIKYAQVVVQKRGQQNVETILECPLDSVNDTETYIYSASQIKAVSDLTNYKIGYADFSKATRLQSLVLHNDMNNANGNLEFLSLGNNKLLQTIICRNTPNLTQSINLVGCTGLQSAYFEGTGISGVQVANGSTIKTLALPNTITNLTLRNTLNLETLTIGDDTDYSNISTLWIENVDSITANKTKLLSFLNDMADGYRVRLVGLDLSVDVKTELNPLYDSFDRFTGIDAGGNNVDSAQISGKITVYVMSDRKKQIYKQRYPFIDIVSETHGVYVHFMNYDGTVETYTDEVIRGDDAVYMTGTEIPTKPSTDEYDYDFVGWSTEMGATEGVDGILDHIYGNTTLYPAFKPVPCYHVHYMSNDGEIELFDERVRNTESAPNDIAENIEDSEFIYEFLGWSSVSGKNNTVTTGVLDNITAEKNVYASYHNIYKDAAPWAYASDDTVATMLSYARQNIIDIYEYWSIGDERQVQLKADQQGVQPNTNGIFVLLDKNKYTLTKGGTCLFAVGMKNCLPNAMRLANSKPDSGTNAAQYYTIESGKSIIYNWITSPTGFQSMLTTTFKNQFKSFYAANTGSADGISVVRYYDRTISALFAIPSYNEINGGLKYYKTPSNRIKNIGDTSTPCTYHTRQGTGNVNNHIGINTSGNSTDIFVTTYAYASVIGCI